jgi:hypothetical protein
MRQIAEFVAVLACSLFTGASVYINLVEHPARMECGVEIAATEFAPSYRRATIMQASSAALGLLSSIAALGLIGTRSAQSETPVRAAAERRPPDKG